MTREEHLAWAKDRALTYVEAGDLQQAFISLCSDFEKHEELPGPDSPIIRLGAQLLFSGHLSTPHRMREWINGFR